MRTLSEPGCCIEVKSRKAVLIADWLIGFSSNEHNTCQPNQSHRSDCLRPCTAAAHNSFFFPLIAGLLSSREIAIGKDQSIEQINTEHNNGGIQHESSRRRQRRWRTAITSINRDDPLPRACPRLCSPSHDRPRRCGSTTFRRGGGLHLPAEAA